ncbi:hypothetical protein BJV78DRAFT_1258732 [Lactifluus subvellereus]|nr:hypothetical protein BJV78DRAFT_1258732 [Lactifluus subvellereus]
MPPRRVPIGPDVERLIQESCTQLCAQAKPNISDIVHKIETHFNANPVLCDDLCFEGLFNRTRRQPAVQTKDEPSNTTPASAGPSSSVLLSFPPPQVPLSSNIVNTHPLSYTSPHLTSMIYPSLHPPPYFFPPHPMRPPLPYHHPTSNVIGTSSHFYDSPHLMQTQN